MQKTIEERLDDLELRLARAEGALKVLTKLRRSPEPKPEPEPPRPANPAKNRVRSALV